MNTYCDAQHNVLTVIAGQYTYIAAQWVSSTARHRRSSQINISRRISANKSEKRGIFHNILLKGSPIEF